MNDTSVAAERILVDGYRAMPAWRKLRQVTALTQAAQRLTQVLEKLGVRYLVGGDRLPVLFTVSRVPHRTWTLLSNWSSAVWQMVGSDNGLPQQRKREKTAWVESLGEKHGIG